MMTFAGHDAGPRGTAIENDFLSTLSVMRSRHLVRKTTTEEMRVSRYQSDRRTETVPIARHSGVMGLPTSDFCLVTVPPGS